MALTGEFKHPLALAEGQSVSLAVSLASSLPSSIQDFSHRHLSGLEHRELQLQILILSQFSTSAAAPAPSRDLHSPFLSCLSRLG